MKHNKNVIRLSESELPKLIDKYVRQALSEGFQFDSTRDEERDYLNSILKNTTHLFRDEEDRNETYRAYVNNERRRGGQPTLDGFLSYIGVSRRDLKQENKKRTTVSLTESDLHTLITEAVKETLNELDPRTYASAADKAKERGEYERMGKFRSAAVNAWNKKFADPINTKTDTLPQRGIRHHYSMEDNDGYNIAMNSQNYKTRKTSSRDYTFDNDGKEYQWDELGNQYEGDGDFGAHESIKYDGMNVARQMARGNGKYVKGKGWQ